MISGEQFQSLSEVSFSSDFNDIIKNQLQRIPQNVKLINEYPVAEIKNYKRIFIYSHDIEKFMSKFYEHLSDNTTIITHNSDIGVGPECLKYLNSNKIGKWFGQNRTVSHPKLFSLPIGLANSQWPHGNQETVNNIANQTNEKKYLVYKNFDLSTNYAKRRYVDEVTGANGIPMDANRPFSDYIKILSESCFVIAPPGNGIDCHRIWECLKLKTIPIVEYHECFSQFTHLPILFIDKWERITPDFLRSNLSMLDAVRKKLPELEIEYWKNLICTE